MRKSTRAISLVLIGSGLILAGCQGCAPPDSGQGGHSGQGGRSGQGGSSSGYHGGYYRSYGGWSGAAAPAASPRGGFGAAGHAGGGS
jgi:hypothetical protein